MRHVIAHEVIECRRLVARKGFPRELVEIVAWPESKTFVYRDEVHESRVDAESMRCPITSRGHDLPGPGRRRDRSSLISRRLGVAPWIASRSSATYSGMLTTQKITVARELSVSPADPSGYRGVSLTTRHSSSRAHFRYSR